jgi:hypothetical protein
MSPTHLSRFDTDEIWRALTRANENAAILEASGGRKWDCHKINESARAGKVPACLVGLENPSEGEEAIVTTARAYWMAIIELSNLEREQEALPESQRSYAVDD